MIDTNLVIDITDPEQRGNSKLTNTNVFKLIGNFFRIKKANRITIIVKTELN